MQMPRRGWGLSSPRLPPCPYITTTTTRPHRPCPQVHSRLKGYVKMHFEHNLKCVEKGLIDPYNA